MLKTKRKCPNSLRSNSGHFRFNAKSKNLRASKSLQKSKIPPDCCFSYSFLQGWIFSALNLMIGLRDHEERCFVIPSSWYWAVWFWYRDTISCSGEISIHIMWLLNKNVSTRVKSKRGWFFLTKIFYIKWRPIKPIKSINNQ